MRPSLAFLIAILLAAPAGAQILPDSSLSGIVCVLDRYEGEGCWEPVPGATVSIHKDGPVAGVLDTDKQATTDENGGFYFDSIPAGTYTITVERAGIKTHEGTVDISGHKNHEVRVSTINVEAVVKAVGPDGEALQGAKVQAWGYGWGQGITDSSGIFRFPTIAGMHDINIAYPGLRSAQSWSFIDGTEQAFELEALPPATHYATGIVQDPDGEPIQGATVRFEQWAEFGQEDWGHFENWTSTRADGSFRLGHYGEDYFIQVEKEGHTPAQTWSPGGEQRHTFTIIAIPDATADVVIHAVDAVTGKPVEHVAASIWHPEYGIWDCSESAYAPEIAYAEPVMVEEVAYSSPSPYRYERPECPLAVDGEQIQGTVIPGYAIIEVWQDWYRCENCTRYHTGVLTVDLKDGSNVFNMTLTPRPQPSSILRGYVLGEDRQPLPDAIVSLSNQDTYGWGEAGTDGDGSYRIKLVPGFHHVYVWAEGHLPWQGTVQVHRDGSVDLDIQLKEGTAAYQPCCYFHEEVAVAHDGGYKEEPMQVSRAPAQGDYEDMGGGLGPYSKDRGIPMGTVEQGAPGLPIIGLLAVVGLAALARRRSAR